MANYNSAHTGQTIDAAVSVVTQKDMSAMTAAFAQAIERANIDSGEALAVLFGKIKKYLYDLENGAFNLIGPKGDPGQAATIAVGTVTTGAAGSAAQISNSGSASAAVLDFVIPKGDTGAKGDPGVQGPQGATGPAGTSVNAIQAANEATALSLSTQNPNNVYFWV